MRLANERAELERFRNAEAERKEAELAAQAAKDRQEREDKIAADAAANAQRAARASILQKRAELRCAV